MIFDKKIATEVINILLKVKAIQLKKQTYFTWASGIKSPIYCDNRIVLGYPTERDRIKILLSSVIQTKFPVAKALSGVATAGISIGALAADELHLPYSYVRSSAKAHGKQNQIEGYIPKNTPIVVIEDLISTGGSTLKAIDALQTAGHQVVGAIAIFTYGFDQAKQAFAEVKIPFYALSSYAYLIKLLDEEGDLDADTKARLLQWQENPHSFK